MSNQIRLNIHLLFAGTGIIILVAGMFMKLTLEIQFYDTYFMASQETTAIYTCGIMEVFSLIYLILNKTGKNLNSNLSLVHYVTTFFASVILLAVPFVNNLLGNLAAWETLSMTVIAAILMFCTGQIVFLINVIQCLVRNEQ